MTYERAPISEILDKYGIAGVHWACDLLPMMSDAEYQALCEDAKTNGFLNPVHIDDDDLVIDGRNRLQAGYAIGLDPTITRLQPVDTLMYVLSENLHRRSLTAGQRASIAAKVATNPNGTNQHSGLQMSATLTTTEAAAQLGTTHQAITQIRTIGEFAPELAEPVAQGTMTLESAYKVAAPRKKQAKSLDPTVKPGPIMLKLPGILAGEPIEINYPKPKGRHTFNVTNEQVDWADWTWNPVTGCLHGCEYCYARELALKDSYKTTYPLGFEPLFHTERLDDPVNTRTKISPDRPQSGRVFVCSMADLFGEWVPAEWIDAVFEAANRAPEWEYLFLTKFPQRYRRINLPPSCWFGTTVDTQRRVRTAERAMPKLDVKVRWLSIEPLLEPLTFNDLSWCDLMVIGAQSGTMQPNGFVPAFPPPIEWVADLIAQARKFDVPVYLKENLLGKIGDTQPGMKFPRETPRERRP